MSSHIDGLAGGLGGHEFKGYTIPTKARLREIHVYADKFIDAIQIFYVGADGEPGELPKIGGLGGTCHVFILDDDEYLTTISGWAGWYIDGLQLHTNKRSSAMFGSNDGERSFRHEAPKGREIIGFFGQADWYIDAIGIITRALPKPKQAAKPKAAKPKVAKPKTAKPAPTPPESRPARPKDLQKIKGIGPKFAQILVENGIVDLQAMANADVATLEQILMNAGPRYTNLADPSSWLEQAVLAAKGDWAALEKLQADL